MLDKNDKDGIIEHLKSTLEKVKAGLADYANLDSYDEENDSYVDAASLSKLYYEVENTLFDVVW